MAQDRHSPATHRFQPPIATTPRRQPPTDPIVFFFVILFLLFFFFLLPLLSHAPKIIKPTPVKVKSNWISFIVFLFLFAIIARILAQNNGAPSTPNVTNRVNNRASESNRNRNQEAQVNGDFRRSSSSSSHLDLRQKPLPENGDNNHPRRREGRKENIHRPELVSGDILHRTRRSEARKVNSRAPAPAATVSGESRKRRTSGRPDRDDLRSTIIDGGDSFGPSPISSTPSSPDVNAKADRYISRLKDKWRTEY